MSRTSLYLAAAGLVLGCSNSGRPPVLVVPVDATVMDGTDDTAVQVSDTSPDMALTYDTGAMGDLGHADAVPTGTDATPDGATADAVTDTAVDDALETGTDVGTDVRTDAGTDATGGMDALTDAGGDGGDGGDGFGPWTPLGDGGCNAQERSVPTQPGLHVDPDAGTPVWLTNPPSSGPHFPTWAHWGVFPNIPRGNWLHNLEHGGVVMLYRCADGTNPVCFPARDALSRAMDTVPMDPACMPTDAAPARVRIVVTNDGRIDTPIAGAAWGWLYAADCVDPGSIRAFYARHGGMAPEDFCGDGFVP